VKRDTHIELGREESNESNQVLSEINMILDGTSIGSVMVEVEKKI